MADQNNQVQAFYTKNPEVSGTASVGSTPQVPKGNKPKPKYIMAIIGVFLFVVVGVAGVLVAQRQRQLQGPVAPNAPASKPKADTAPENTCTLYFDVPYVTPSPTPSVSPTPTPSVSPTPTPRVTPSPTPTPSVTPTPSPTPTPGVTPSPTPRVTPTPGVTPSPTPVTYVCGGPCETDEQCQTVNASYFCSEEYSNTCRLYSNPSSSSCQPQVNQYACNSYCTADTDCHTVNPNYMCYNNACRLASNPEATNCLPIAYVPPAPAVGCNEICQTNADCSQPQHVCYTTTDGSNRCRHQDYVNSSTCTAPPATVTTYVASAPVQPELPAELPRSGAFEVANWIKAGLITLGLGAALLLLL